MNEKNRTQETTATEIIGDLGRQLQRLERLSQYTIIALTVISIGLLVINYRHAIAHETINRQWIEYLSQYDFVSQDGDGYNYFNSNVEGDVNNGTER